jgi:WD repeat-containing protein 23
MDDEELMDEIDAMDDDVEVEEEDDDPGATTLYFDAEEGTLRTANGEEVQLESEVADEEEETQGDGTATPRPQGEQTARPTQRIACE